MKAFNIGLLAFTMLSVCHGWKLNVPRVLLPTADEGASFLVYSKSGCFTWTSTRPEVVKAIPVETSEDDASCSTAANIVLPPRPPQTPALSKTQAVVTAEDVHSDGRILRLYFFLKS